MLFLFLLKNIDCGYSLEPPCQGSSNEYTQSIILSRNMKKYQFFFYQKNFSFWSRFSIYLNRLVFIIMVCKFSDIGAQIMSGPLD